MALIKDVDSITKDCKLRVRKVGEKFEHTSLLPDDEWYPKAVRPKIRPARWNWKDCYAKLEEIASFVRGGEDVRVLAAESGEDITRRILGQILLEDANRDRLGAMPIDLLRQMIALKDDTLFAWLEQYLAAGAKWLERQAQAETEHDVPMVPPEVLVPAQPVRSARA